MFVRSRFVLAVLLAIAALGSSPSPGSAQEDFASLVKRTQSEKPVFAKRQQDKCDSAEAKQNAENYAEFKEGGLRSGFLFHWVMFGNEIHYAPFNVEYAIRRAA